MITALHTSTGGHLVGALCVSKNMTECRHSKTWLWIPISDDLIKDGRRCSECGDTVWVKLHPPEEARVLYVQKMKEGAYAGMQGTLDVE